MIVFGREIGISPSLLATKRNLIILIGVVIVLIATILTVYLIRQQQQLKSQAAGGPIEFVTGPNLTCDANGNCTTTDLTVQTRVTAP